MYRHLSRPSHFLRAAGLTIAPFVLLAAARAQTLQLGVTPSASLATGQALISVSVTGTPGTPFLVLLDVGSGPTTILGLDLQLELSPSAFVALSGTVPQPSGSVNTTFVIPSAAGLADTPFYLQAVGFDPSLNRLVASRGASFVLHTTSSAISQSFSFPALEGYSGNAAIGIFGALTGAQVMRRTVRPYLPSTELAPFVYPSPLAFPTLEPLDPRGAKVQLVYRQGDLTVPGATEVVEDIRWHAHPSTPVTADAFAGLEILLGHTSVQPDFSIDPFAGFPLFPNSGLSETFAANPTTPLQSVRSGAYSIDPTQAGPGGVSYGPLAPFVYNGTDGLLVEFRTNPSAMTLGVNGIQTFVAIPQGGTPFSSVRDVLPPLGTGTIDPASSLTGFGTNWLYDLEFDLARISSRAQSPFFFAGPATPDYRQPTLATFEPPGSRIEIEYRGADDLEGANATPFSTDVDIADGKPCLQFRVTFFADAASGAVPSIDTLVVPVQ